MQTALYFDTVNFAPRITAPTAVAIGFIDTTAPPAGIFTALNQVRGRHEAIPMIESAHNNITPQKQGAWDARWRAVLASVLETGTF
jgi:cephalosporin-C deacetylase